MKTILTLALAASIGATANAGVLDQISQSTVRKIEALGLLSYSGVTVTPEVSKSCSGAANVADCFYRYSLSWSALSSSTVFSKEELQNVEVDAYDFLAGRPMTLALEEVVQKVRTVEDTAQLTDEEVVVAILNFIQ